MAEQMKEVRLLRLAAATKSEEGEKAFKNVRKFDVVYVFLSHY